MARQIPADRFAKLVEAATRVFIRQGYARTQMADVADALGVAKGTLYLYVESKEALFDLVVRHADAGEAIEVPEQLPVATPEAGSTTAFARAVVADNANLAALTEALERKRVDDVAGEVEEIVRGIYRTVRNHRTGIKLIDRCAPDYPELAELWFRGGREGLMTLLTGYLEDRIARGALRAQPDTAVTARVIIELAAFWAVHRHWDAHPQTVEEEVAEETVVHFVLGALLPKQGRTP